MRVCAACGKNFRLDRNDFEDTDMCLACRRRRINNQRFDEYIVEYPFCGRCGVRRTPANSHHHFDCDACAKKRRAE